MCVRSCSTMEKEEEFNVFDDGVTSDPGRKPEEKEDEELNVVDDGVTSDPGGKPDEEQEEELNIVDDGVTSDPGGKPGDEEEKEEFQLVDTGVDDDEENHNVATKPVVPRRAPRPNKRVINTFLPVDGMGMQEVVVCLGELNGLVGITLPNEARKSGSVRIRLHNTEFDDSLVHTVRLSSIVVDLHGFEEGTRVWHRSCGEAQVERVYSLGHGGAGLVRLKNGQAVKITELVRLLDEYDAIDRTAIKALNKWRSKNKAKSSKVSAAAAATPAKAPKVKVAPKSAPAKPVAPHAPKLAPIKPLKVPNYAPLVAPQAPKRAKVSVPAPAVPITPANCAPKQAKAPKAAPITPAKSSSAAAAAAPTVPGAPSRNARKRPPPCSSRKFFVYFIDCGNHCNIMSQQSQHGLATTQHHLATRPIHRVIRKPTTLSLTTMSLSKCLRKPRRWLRCLRLRLRQRSPLCPTTHSLCPLRRWMC